MAESPKTTPVDLKRVARIARLMAWGFGMLVLAGCANMRPRVECKPVAPKITKPAQAPIQKCEVQL